MAVVKLLANVLFLLVVATVPHRNDTPCTLTTLQCLSLLDYHSNADSVPLQIYSRTVVEWVESVECY